MKSLFPKPPKSIYCPKSCYSTIEKKIIPMVL